MGTRERATRLRSRCLVATVLTAGAVCAAAPAPAVAAPVRFDAKVADVDPFGTYYGYRARGTVCKVATVSGAGAQTIYAKTTWEMWAAKGKQVYQLRFRARLIPTTASLNFTRPWSPWASAIIPSVYNGNRYYLSSWVTTPSASAMRAWRVEVRLNWDRANRRDWNRDLKFKLNQGGACAPGNEA